MKAHGYPVTDFDQRAADFSVDHMKSQDEPLRHSALSFHLPELSGSDSTRIRVSSCGWDN
jgi:hypothetical protein